MPRLPSPPRHLRQGPVVRPTLAEMNDLRSYLAATVAPLAELHGAVRIDPPPDWPRPPLDMRPDSRFFVRTQTLPERPPPAPTYIREDRFVATEHETTQSRPFDSQHRVESVERAPGNEADTRQANGGEAAIRPLGLSETVSCEEEGLMETESRELEPETARENVDEKSTAARSKYKKSRITTGTRRRARTKRARATCAENTQPYDTRVNNLPVFPDMKKPITLKEYEARAMRFQESMVNTMAEADRRALGKMRNEGNVGTARQVALTGLSAGIESGGSEYLDAGLFMKDKPLDGPSFYGQASVQGPTTRPSGNLAAPSCHGAQQDSDRYCSDGMQGADVLLQMQTNEPGANGIGPDRYEEEFWRLMTYGMNGRPLTVIYGVDVEKEETVDYREDSLKPLPKREETKFCLDNQTSMGGVVVPRSHSNCGFQRMKFASLPAIASRETDSCGLQLCNGSTPSAEEDTILPHRPFPERQETRRAGHDASKAPNVAHAVFHGDECTNVTVPSRGMSTGTTPFALRNAGGPHGAQQTSSGDEAVVQQRGEKLADQAKWHVGNINKAGVLRHLPRMPGINTPMYYVGQLFTRFCWHVEDSFLNSISYLHSIGHEKVWYAIPPSSASDFEAYAAQHVFSPHLQHDFRQPSHGLLMNKTTLFDPRDVVRRGIPVSRIVHKPGTIVFTAPRAYHAGFNCGFNVAEAVNFALPTWFPRGRLASVRNNVLRRPHCIPLEYVVYREALALTRHPLAAPILRSTVPLLYAFHSKVEGARPSPDNPIHLRLLREDARCIAAELRHIIDTGERALAALAATSPLCTVIDGDAFTIAPEGDDAAACHGLPHVTADSGRDRPSSAPLHRMERAHPFGPGAGLLCSVCGVTAHFYAAVCAVCRDGGHAARCAQHFGVTAEAAAVSSSGAAAAAAVSATSPCGQKGHYAMVLRRHDPVRLLDVLHAAEAVGGVTVPAEEIAARYTGYMRAWAAPGARNAAVVAAATVLRDGLIRRGDRAGRPRAQPRRQAGTRRGVRRPRRSGQRQAEVVLAEGCRASGTILRIWLGRGSGSRGEDVRAAGTVLRLALSAQWLRRRREKVRWSGRRVAHGGRDTVVEVVEEEDTRAWGGGGADGAGGGGGSGDPEMRTGGEGSGMSELESGSSCSVNSKDDFDIGGHVAATGAVRVRAREAVVGGRMNDEVVEVEEEAEILAGAEMTERTVKRGRDEVEDQEEEEGRRVELVSGKKRVRRQERNGALD